MCKKIPLLCGTGLFLANLVCIFHCQLFYYSSSVLQRTSTVYFANFGYAIKRTKKVHSSLVFVTVVFVSSLKSYLHIMLYLYIFYFKTNLHLFDLFTIYFATLRLQNLTHTLHLNCFFVVVNLCFLLDLKLFNGI